MCNLLDRIGIMTKHHSVVQIFFDRLVLQHPRIVCLCVLAAVGFLGFQARRFRLDASAETLVLENDEDLRYQRLINSRYEKHNFLVLTYTPKGELFAEITGHIGQSTRRLKVLKTCRLGTFNSGCALVGKFRPLHQGAYR